MLQTQEGHQIPDTEQDTRKRRLRLVVVAYPFVLVLFGLAGNLLLFGVAPLAMALPSQDVLAVLVIASVLLLINHSWLMTQTELTRGRYGLYATPEEWTAARKQKSQAPVEGLDEVERCHNAHRNTTENVVYFVFLAALMALVSPSFPAVVAWVGGFAVARLGYSYAYLSGRPGLRGLFISLGLLSVYGMATYLVLAVFF